MSSSVSGKPAAKPRTKPADERRDDLLRAAERLFLAKGVAATTIDDVTRAAGIAKGTFYLHFASKADVLDALRDGFVRTVSGRIAGAVGHRSADDWTGRLQAWSDAFVEAYLDLLALHDLVFVEAPPASRAGLSKNPLIDDLARLLAAGDEAGAWRAVSPAFTAAFLFGALHGLVASGWVAAQERSAALAAIRAQILNAVGATGEDRRLPR
ncbi:TetR/AcrR family transcriptional regulator [Segnochrobactrum spirostomi]|uniref:TetR/AcrR family transcriptional regulator n=1 Tax=Segnochrobactrum spirostomi TaxID=2608987 RepID=A0A6A7XZ61_9HYPH|nr:TetR/AcrR family transcriptional regulator [Segnochrobactrum spirostomi]MQT11588.1 TetR/AcrR family transcriptional regulator [Segnochrobactrum spirostomi]